MAIKGVDVSSYQGNPDWARVAGDGDVLFAIVKASEGVTWDDPSFIFNWAAIKSAGLARGAYHYARPSNNTPEKEVDHFLARVDAAGGLETGDLLALDMEDVKATANRDLHDWTLAWLQRVESRVGFKPLFYSGEWYMTPHGLSGLDDLAEYGLWLSVYNYQFDAVPNAPANWGQILIHQYSDKGTVAGIPGSAVDLNTFPGTSIDELLRYGSPGSSNAAPTYTVQPGDTWESIAAQYGIGVGDLMSANANFDQLEVGMVLMIPTTATA